MLKLIRSMRELDFGELLSVYCESEEIYGRYENEDIGKFAAEQEFYQYLNDIFFRTPDSYYALWRPQGSAVAALRLEPYRDGLLLAALETAPAARGMGHATELVSAVVSEFADWKIYAHIRKNNAASMRVHSKCGFKVLSDSATMIDGSFTYSHCTICYDNKEKPGNSPAF